MSDFVENVDALARRVFMSVFRAAVKAQWGKLRTAKDVWNFVYAMSSNLLATAFIPTK
jgi:hypothetical protein